MKTVLDNCEYNEIKLLHELSSLQWFLKQHAIKDAQAANHEKCKEFMEFLAHDLEKHIGALREKMGKPCK